MENMTVEENEKCTPAAKISWALGADRRRPSIAGACAAIGEAFPSG
jgi:hypothetical protein